MRDSTFSFFHLTRDYRTSLLFLVPRRGTSIWLPLYRGTDSPMLWILSGSRSRAQCLNTFFPAFLGGNPLFGGLGLLPLTTCDGQCSSFHTSRFTIGPIFFLILKKRSVPLTGMGSAISMEDSSLPAKNPSRDPCTFTKIRLS